MSISPRELSIATGERIQLVDITRLVQELVDTERCHTGYCVIFVPHTTAGLTINENADPDVRRDIIQSLDRIVPRDDKYRHQEGNSPAHIKASLLGFSQTVFIEAGRLKLGTWQGIYLAEFDGPRQRAVWVRIIPA